MSFSILSSILTVGFFHSRDVIIFVKLFAGLLDCFFKIACLMQLKFCFKVFTNFKKKVIGAPSETLTSSFYVLRVHTSIFHKTRYKALKHFVIYWVDYRIVFRKLHILAIYFFEVVLNCAACRINVRVCFHFSNLLNNATCLRKLGTTLVHVKPSNIAYNFL